MRGRRRVENKSIGIVRKMRSFGPLLPLAGLALAAPLEDCPGYKASNVEQSQTGLTADLTLAGEPCDVYGDDLPDLKLLVEHQTGKRSDYSPQLLLTLGR